MSYHMSARRKIAIATWSSPREGNIYGKMSIDMTNAIKYIEHLRNASGQKITITHLVGKAVGLAYAECPDLNGRIFLGRYIPHNTVDISFLVSLEGGKDLFKCKICTIDKKSVVEIAEELAKGSDKLRTGNDKSLQKSKGMIKLLPTWLLRPIIWLGGYVTGAMGVDAPWLGFERYPFGGAIVTSVGMFGVDEGFAPPTPFARVPVYVTIPEIKKKAVVVNDQIVIRPMLALTVTIDHRFMDGHRGAMIAKLLRNLLENPWLLDGKEKPLEFTINHIDQASSICENRGVTALEA